MGYCEAIEDGIKHLRDSGGWYYYSIPCELCGKEVRNGQYSRTRRYLCDYCKKMVTKKEKIAAELLNGVETTREQRFDKAIVNIRNQVKDISEYDNAIRIAKTRAERYGSVPEAMVAIELLKQGYKIIPQQSVGKYRVDFAIPSLKLVIEVDGALYHKPTSKSKREGAIQIMLGFDWKIAHVPAELIAKDIKKLEPIMQSLS